MKTPLENVPLNTHKAYVMAKTNCGCEIYLPVDSTDDTVLQTARDDLQNYLKTRDDLPPLQLA